MRQPMSSTSGAKWKHYEKQLAPPLQILNLSKKAPQRDIQRGLEVVLARPAVKLAVTCPHNRWQRGQFTMCFHLSSLERGMRTASNVDQPEPMDLGRGEIMKTNLKHAILAFFGLCGGLGGAPIWAEGWRLPYFRPNLRPKRPRWIRSRQDGHCPRLPCVWSTLPPNKVRFAPPRGI